MQFSNFSRSVSGNTITLRNEIPIENVDKIKYFTDDSTGSFVKKEVRWSFNASYWSAWQTLAQGALTSINTRGARFTFLELRYVLVAAGSGDVSKFTVNFTQRQVTPTPELCPVPRTDGLTKYEVVKITDADTLNGYPGVWYLNRANHIGQQGIGTVSGLQQIINQLFNLNAFSIDNVPGSGAGVFSYVDGSVWWFRRIVSTTGAITVDTVGDQVQIGFDASVSGETIWSDPDPVSASVGGITAGTDISLGNNSIKILEKMLYEYFPPNVDLLLNPSSGYYEKWDSFVPTAEIFGSFDNTPFVKVRVTDISAYVSVNNAPYQPVSEAPTTISYPDASSGVFSFDDGSFPNWEDVTYKIRVYHNVNSLPMQPYDVSISLKFVEPYIWGIVDDTVNVNNLTPSILQGFHALGQKLIVPKQSNQILYERDPLMLKIKFVYAYPVAYGELSSIFDVVNDFNVTSSFDTSTRNIVIGASSPVPYRFYIKSHWINVEKFTLRFNI